MGRGRRLDSVFQLAVCAMLLICITSGLLLVYVDMNSQEKAEAAVLKQGSTGQTIRTVQTRLKQWGYYKGAVDGIFGPQTYAAVRFFQSRNGLVVDGIIGAKTAAALGISLAASSTSYSNDSYLLARCVYAEARGEPYVGQVAVAAVVLNRVKSSSFPNTISGVIYQPSAFTAVADGQINLAPDNTAVRAANDALNGWDPTYGCLYYYNPATATSAWIRQKPIHLRIGSHAFCA